MAKLVPMGTVPLHPATQRRLMLLGPSNGEAPAMPRPPGRMRVVLNVHGGQVGLARVLDGLVNRNARAVQAGAAPPFAESNLKRDGDARAWKDAPMAMVEGYASPSTEAAWYAGELRARGEPVALGFRNGHPAVYGPNGRVLKVWPNGRPLKLGEKDGRCDERMLLLIDDEKATAVREINQAIARHNALRIREKGLPRLYQSGVIYKTEGSPEMWSDAEEILTRGHDDCEGLSAYRAGELMLQWPSKTRGKPPDGPYDAQVWTRLVKMPDKAMGGSGTGRLFHAVVKILSDPNGPVRQSDGTAVYDDPSARLGMPVPKWYSEFAAQMRADRKGLDASGSED